MSDTVGDWKPRWRVESDWTDEIWCGDRCVTKCMQTFLTEGGGGAHEIVRTLNQLESVVAARSPDIAEFVEQRIKDALIAAERKSTP